MNRTKLIYLVLLCFCIQGCTVYRRTPVSMNETVNKGKVKLITHAGTIEKYRKIEMSNDSTYKGLTFKNGKNLEYVLNEDMYTEIFMENRPASDIINTLMVLQILILLFSIIQLQSGSFISFNGI